MILEPTPANLTRAIMALREGGLVSFPTETVYGLGARVEDERAVAEIFARKGRPSFNPLIVHVDGVETAKRYVVWNDAAEKLAVVFWPGPLTLVLSRAAGSKASLLASAGGDSLAVRAPAHSVAQSLLKGLGEGIAAPSANKSGRISPTRAEHVAEEFGDDLLILDAGACEVGIESTVVDVRSRVITILRPGSITREQLEHALGTPVATLTRSDGGKLASPGMLESHYAPTLPVRLNATTVEANEALLAFSGNVPSGAATVRNLSPSGDMVEAAANLFAMLRDLDQPQWKAIAVMPIPSTGLGEAILDRLQRAAAERKAS